MKAGLKDFVKLDHHTQFISQQPYLFLIKKMNAMSSALHAKVLALKQIIISFV